jgi:membrane protein implicated in regulation of membrane protease activity
LEVDMSFYLAALVIGLVLSFLSLVLGAFHLHLPRSFGHISFGGHAHAGQLLPSGHGHGGATPKGGSGSEISPANFSSIVMFLAWFGGAGAILRGELHLGPFVSFVGATAAGVLGAYLLLVFLRRVLLAKDHAMRAADYALPGLLATVTLAIRPGGTGEISYTQGGTRKSAAARSDEGEGVALGAEVMVTSFENGIARVRPWSRVDAQERDWK